MNLKAHVIQHIEFEDLGNLQGELARLGFQISYFRAHSESDLDFMEQATPDLLVVLGGPIGVNDNTHYPFLDREKRIIERQIKADKPLIGICLGAQLIASVLGGKVYPGHVREIGWGQVFSEPGIKHPLHVLNGLQVLHWHGDTFDTPGGATRLMHSEHYKNQAFCAGNNIIALQFHLEVKADRVEDWLLGHANELFSVNRELITKIRADSSRFIPKITESATSFWADWLAQTNIYVHQAANASTSDSFL